MSETLAPTAVPVPPGSPRPEWINLFLFPLLVGVVMLPVGYWSANYQNRIQIMRYGVVSAPSLFPTPDVGSRSLAVTLDGNEIQNVSSVTVYATNGNKDLPNVPVHLSFGAVNGQPPKLIYARPKLPPERYREVSLADVGDGSLRLGYEIVAFNRDQTFQVDLLFEGAVAPPVTLDAIVPGVSVERVELRSKEESSTYSVFGWYVFTIAALLAIGILETINGIRYRADTRKLLEIHRSQEAKDRADEKGLRDG